MGALTSDRSERAYWRTLKKRRSGSLSAYDLVLLANESRLLATKEGNAKGFEYANNAIALDPNRSRLPMPAVDGSTTDTSG